MKFTKPSFQILNNNGNSPIIISAEHSSNFITEELNNLGLKTDIINSGAGYDIGTKEVTEMLSEKLNCSVILSNYSRLIIDCNRTLNEGSLIADMTYGIKIPGNQNLSQKNIDIRKQHIYTPYHNALQKIIEDKLLSYKEVFYVLIHSFDTTFNGVIRDFDIGLLWDENDSLALQVKDTFKKLYPRLKIELNKPYDLRKVEQGSFHIHGLKENILPVEIEINKKLLQSKQDIENISEKLSKVFMLLSNKN